MQNILDNLILLPSDGFFFLRGFLSVVLIPLAAAFLCMRKWGTERTAQIVGAMLTLLVIGYQTTFLVSAGGLWRDEANSVHLATVSSLSALWDNLDGDSFPLLWLLVLRVWAMLGLTQTDAGVRLLGFFIALCVLGALWLVARWMRLRVPLVALALFACNPVVARCVGANRAYGLGIALLLLTYGRVWLAVQTPTRRNFALASVCAVLATQTLYYNTVFVWAILAGAGAVCVKRGEWKRVRAFAAMGALAATLMFPYLHTVAKQRQWSMLSSLVVDLPYLWETLTATLGAAGVTPHVWTLLIVGALAFAVRAAFARPQSKQPTIAVPYTREFRTLSTAQRDLTLFCATTMPLAIAGYLGFLKILHYAISPWYYAALMAVVSISLDAIIAAWITARPLALGILQPPPSTFARRLMASLAATPALAVCLYGVTALAALGVRTTVDAARVRQTNVDLLAAEVQRQAKTGDFVVIFPWYLGTPFARYYAGQAQYTNVPPMPGLRFGGIQAMKQAMLTQQPLQPVLAQIAVTLQSGHRVYVVGKLLRRKMPPSRALDPRWDQLPYLKQWSGQVDALLQTHATHQQQRSITNGQVIFDLENAPLEVWQGWH